MEREKGSQGVEGGPRVVTETGREGTVIAYHPERLEFQVRFDDGGVEWIATEKARELPREVAEFGGIPRELGS